MITAEWVTDLSGVYAIRREVFTEEQGIAEELDADGSDDGALHVLARENGEPAGTGRLKEIDGRYVIGRLAVRRDKRGIGIGDLIARLLIRRAWELGARRQYVHAQLQAAPFYEKLGFKAVGEPYIEAGAKHVNMEREGDITGECARV
ncbi:MAG: GNAT family N-acetyltransferase [Clostridiales bacterium]|jgi:ElaA protein|nr:GNAT family N-acetyltransferase [Clostridiales bacterium]